MNTVNKTKKYIYSCFVDFEKAFDTIPRDQLFKKLFNMGINGNFFNILKHLYNDDTASLKTQNKISKPFRTNQGVRQGCVLSPLLFNHYMADFTEEINKCADKVKISHEVEAGCILWADDILLLSEGGLREMLLGLEKFCSDSKLNVNVKKKCMIFNKTGRIKHRIFHYKGIPLENVFSYKYLGFLVTPSGSITKGLEDLRDRALKALMKIRHGMGKLFNKMIRDTLRVFDYMAKPLLLYASDFWGCHKLPVNNPIDRLFNSVCRQMLGVQNNTSTKGCF